MAKILRILNWNVHLDTFSVDNQYVVNVIKSADKPDVICLQEYVKGADSTTKEWLEKNEYSLTYLPFAHYPENKSLSQGLLVAVKKTFSVNLKTIILREDEPRMFRNFSNIRGIITCSIKNSNGSVVTIINVHSTFARPYTVDMRKREFKKLVEYLDLNTENTPILLCGDFNFLPFDSRKRHLKARFDFYTGNISEPTWRHDYKFSPIRANLDYIFWNKELLNVSSKLLPFSVSDHRPIIIEITI